MDIEQLSLFSNKESFNPRKLMVSIDKEVLSQLTTSVHEAFSIFSMIDVSDFDPTTKANMLNNLVVRAIERNVQSPRFLFDPSLSKTRRGFAILNDEYVIFFKKNPVRNIKSEQDDMIKNQRLDKHVLFLVYTIDEWWTSVASVKLEYFKNFSSTATFSYDISPLVKPFPSFAIPEERALRPKLKNGLKEESKAN